jgi:hypothetical protein
MVEPAFFKDSLNFAYQPGNSTLLAYQFNRFVFKNIYFEVQKPIGHAMFLKGMEVVFEKCELIYYHPEQNGFSC